MAVGVFGVPFLFTRLCVRLIGALLAREYGSFQQKWAVNLSEVETLWSTDGLPNLVLYSHIPEPQLIDFLVQREVPIVVFLSDFEATAQGIVDVQPLPPVEAIRKTTLSMACLEDAILAPNALIIRSNDGNRTDLLNLLEQFIHFLGIKGGRLAINEVIKELSLRWAEDGRIYFEDQLDKARVFAGLSTVKGTGDLGEFGGVISELSGYDAIVDMQLISNVCWPAKLFLARDNKGCHVDGPLTLTGPARVLAHGPYCGLPRGSWTVTLYLTVSGNISGNELLLTVSQLRGKTILARGTLKLPPFGAFCCDLNFAVENPHHPIEVVIATREGAIEGEMRFMKADFRRC